MTPRPAARPTVRPSARDRIEIEAIVAVSPPTAFRLSPDGRSVACLESIAGALQLCVVSLRGGPRRQLSGSAEDLSDPQWSPDGTRLAYVRGTAIWAVDADGGRPTRVVDHPAGNTAPRWAPDGERLAFLSRRRGWSQLWLVDVPRPGRGRPPAVERLPEPRRLTDAPEDLEHPAWSPDGARILVSSLRSADLATNQLLVVDVEAALAGRPEPVRVVAGEASMAVGGSWWPDSRSIVYVDDRSGWFQVRRAFLDRRGALGEDVALTDDEVEHGEPSGAPIYAPHVSPDRRHVAHITVHDGLTDLVVTSLDRPGRRPGRSVTVQPGPGVWRIVDWSVDGFLLAVGDTNERPQDLWLLPVPGLAARSARARQLTDSLPRALPVHRFVPPERVAFEARDGLRIEATLWRPAEAGAAGGRDVPVIVHAHGGPTSQTQAGWWPLFQLFVQEGMAVLAVDFRGSTGYGRSFRRANVDEWGHADAFDLIDGARWAADQAWCDGRLAIHGGSYGGYMTLCCLVEEPGLWRCGVDLYGDSEIAESYRHGDRIGRIDLERMMGRPENPAQAELFRRGSPIYRAERIEAPVLIIHGRQDKRVVPLMSERMVEALEIEGKHHEIRWYEEPHGTSRWRDLANRRDADERVLAFLKRHLLEEEPGA
ncbi:MAG TPA: S9 family peptidase [Candidatus Limnocylindrales bacterium]|nr:S9 family peptidase [Candidatus Limnocylindrales bacterium]